MAGIGLVAGGCVCEAFIKWAAGLDGWQADGQAGWIYMGWAGVADLWFS